MASKKQDVPGEGRTARGTGGRRAAHTSTRAKMPPEGTGNAARDPAHEATAAPGGAASGPPRGLDEARHVAAQRAAHQAEVMREALFPALMADALGYGGTFDSRAYKVFLDRLLEDAGNPSDPVERMLLEQLGLAHFRIGQLQVSAGQAKSVEAAKVYNSVAARLLGEFRRTALALRVYKARVPEGTREARLKIFKQAE
jgi:hypothetical protein